MCFPNGFYHINRGTTMIQDKVMKEMVLVVKFVPFEKMTKDEFNEYEFLIHTLIKMKNKANSIKSNAAMKSRKMFESEWRAGTYFCF